MGLSGKQCNAICFVVLVGVALNSDGIAIEFGGTCRCRNAVVGENMQARGNNDRRTAIVVHQVHDVGAPEFFGQSVEQ